jgi:hypothetical protein
MPTPITSNVGSRVTPTFEAKRALLAAAKLPQVSLVASEDGRKASGTLDIPLSAFRPPVTKQQVEAEGFVHVQLPATENAVSKTEVVDGPSGPALRVKLTNIEPGALVSLPLRLELGKREDLAQDLPAGELPEGSILASSGRIKLRVAFDEVAMDGTALKKHAVRGELAQARTSLVSFTQAEQAQRDAPVLANRQLEGELATAKRAEQDAAAHHATLRAQVLEQLRGAPNATVVMAVLVNDDAEAFAAGQAALQRSTPETLASWAQHRERVLGQLSELDLERAAATLGGPSLEQARRAHTQAQAQVTTTSDELARRRSLPTGTASLTAA